MAAQRHPGWHNVRVIPPASAVRRLPRLRPAVGVVVLLAAALVLGGCGGTPKAEKTDPTPSVTTPTQSVEVPAGVTLTDAGTKLAFGQSATVAYQPNDKRSTVLRLQVTKVTRGTIAELSAYVLDARTRQSTPYYVHVKVANLGTGDVGHTDVPLWVVDNTDTLIHSSSFTNSFTKCPSKALPTPFAPHATLSTCLVYLVPNHGTLTSVSFRPVQALEPILWRGPVTPDSSHQAHHAKKHAKQKKGKKKS
jgi:hypothetical protein